MSQERIEAIERQIGELTSELGALRKASEGYAVRNYEFETGAGKTTLLDLFADKDRLLVIHNMGQGCRYCTLWADGFNGLLPHLGVRPLGGACIERSAGQCNAPSPIPGAGGSA